MMNPKKLEEIAKQIHDALPAGVKQLGDEMDRKVKQVLQSQLNKLDMVTREEFEVQTKVLLRTREKLMELEKRLYELEERQGEE